MADQMTDEEKRRCQQWLNEQYSVQAATRTRSNAIREARARAEQEQDYGFDGETTGGH
jgi:hypothetical protein